MGKNRAVKKLITSACALVVAVLLLITAIFAWFTMPRAPLAYAPILKIVGADNKGFVVVSVDINGEPNEFPEKGIPIWPNDKFTFELKTVFEESRFVLSFDLESYSDDAYENQIGRLLGMEYGDEFNDELLLGPYQKKSSLTVAYPTKQDIFTDFNINSQIKDAVKNNSDNFLDLIQDKNDPNYDLYYSWYLDALYDYQKECHYYKTAFLKSFTDNNNIVSAFTAKITNIKGDADVDIPLIQLEPEDMQLIPDPLLVQQYNGNGDDFITMRQGETITIELTYGQSLNPDGSEWYPEMTLDAAETPYFTQLLSKPREPFGMTRVRDVFKLEQFELIDFQSGSFVINEDDGQQPITYRAQNLNCFIGQVLTLSFEDQP